MGAEVVTDYAYDEINRLTKETTCDYLNAYYYDDGGNRTKMVKMNAVYSKDGNGRIVSMLTKASASPQGLTKTYYYSNYTELTKMTASEYGGTTRDYTYEHDNAGRLTRQVQNVFTPNSTTTFNYEWDALDRMTKVQRVASGVTKTINYTYNAAGLRVRRVDTSTSVTKLWSYQGANIASVQTSSGGGYGSEDYVYTVGPGMINNALERHKLNGTGSDSRYYQFDHRGNAVAVTDSTGKILRGYQYDAFGNQTFSFQQGSSTPPTKDDILFTGKDYDEDTGLYYFGARWYDAELGRYVSRTLLPRDKEHSYLFCGNNPMSLVDWTGLKGEGWALGGMILGGVVLGIAVAATFPYSLPVIGAMTVAGGGSLFCWLEYLAASENLTDFRSRLGDAGPAFVNASVPAAGPGFRGGIAVGNATGQLSALSTVNNPDGVVDPDAPPGAVYRIDGDNGHQSVYLDKDGHVIRHHLRLDPIRAH
jgi:RHS repeat-associated protein